MATGVGVTDTRVNLTKPRLQIDAAVDHIMRIRGPGWEIDTPRIGRALAHHAHEISTIVGAQRRHGKHIHHAGVRKTEIAPRQKFRKIGLKTCAVQDAVDNRVPPGHEHTPIEQPAIALGFFCPVRGNPRVFTVGPIPRPIIKNEIGVAQRNKAHASSMPSATTMAPPPIDARVSVPFAT